MKKSYHSIAVPMKLAPRTLRCSAGVGATGVFEDAVVGAVVVEEVVEDKELSLSRDLVTECTGV